MSISNVSFFALIASTAIACGGDDPCDTEVPGNVCTIAGNGNNGYDKTADDESLPALKARLSLPQDTLTAPDGTIYLLDWNNHRIRSITADGMITWVAGIGELGGGLDDPANGDFNHPTNIIFDESGENIIIAAWHNSKIRTLNLASGEIIDTCGSGGRSYFGDGGPAISAVLDLPASIALDPAGDLIVMDQANQVIRKIDQNGDISLLAGQCIIDAPTPTGPGPCAEDQEPVQCPASEAGESGKWTCGDPEEFCSLPCTPGYGGDDGPATEMRIAQPFGQSATPAGRILYDDEGSLFFADTSNHLIRKIDSSGVVTRVAGIAPVDGVAQKGFAGDGGQATEALINYPVDLDFGDDGTLYFTDVFNHCVRAISPAGIISTVAGVCGTKGFEGDDGPAGEALFNLPFGLEVANGRLIIADTGNQVVRSVLLP
tara:strand:- start:22053 stop:23345 length:1293 start_codon:yes stop_codon:yes gene_type:complete